MADITSSLFPEVGSLFNQQYLGAQQAGREGVAAGMGTGLQAARSQAMGLASESGYRLGSGIGRALGGTTPEEQQAAKVKAIADEITASGGNVQSEKGLTLMAQRLNASGDYDIANKVMAAAQILRKQEAEVAAKQAETGFKQSQTAKQQAETTKIKTGLTNEVTAKKTAKAALEAQGVDPTQIEGILNNPKALESYLKQVDERTQTVEVDGRVKLINKADGKVIADLGTAPQRGTNVSIDTKAEGKFAEGMAAVDVKRIETAQIAKTAAINELGSLSKMAELDNKQLFSGSMASGRIGAANFLNTIGLASASDAAKLATSEQFTKISSDLILSKIKALGTNPSNTDRDFIAKIVPQLENSPTARKELINYLAKRAREIVAEADRMEAHGRTNKTLSGYSPKVPVDFSIAAPGSATSMTTEQLLALYKQQKGQ